MLIQIIAISNLGEALRQSRHHDIIRIDSINILDVFLIVLRSNVDATLLVVIVKSLWSALMKSAMTSDLIFLRAMSILVTCL